MILKAKVALIGNPNVGKSVVFTNLTGTKQHTGNWPGKTVEKREGYYTFNDCEFEVIDLPGVYSLTARSEDERVAREYIVDSRPDVVVDVINAAQLERNLYLTLLLIELQVNLVVVLNMYDIVEGRGDTIDTEKLSEMLRAPVITAVATRQEGMDELRQAILEAVPKNHAACDEEEDLRDSQAHKAGEPDSGDHLHYHPRLHHHGEFEKLKPPTVKYDGKIERKLKQLVDILSEDRSFFDRFPPRWLALRLLERDTEYLDMIQDTDMKRRVLEVTV